MVAKYMNWLPLPVSLLRAVIEFANMCDRDFYRI